VFTLLVISVLHLIPSAPGSIPYRGPQLASSSKLAALAYGSDKSIYLAPSNNQGESFSDPVRVAEAGLLPLSRHPGTRIAFSKDPIVVTALAGSVTGKNECLESC
jgi:hypothetical protein